MQTLGGAPDHIRPQASLAPVLAFRADSTCAVRAGLESSLGAHQKLQAAEMFAIERRGEIDVNDIAER